MSSRIRFDTARDVYELFADLKRIAAPPKDDSAPLDYARVLLSSPRPSEAVIFMAHLLPRREAVWWAIQCVRAMLGPSSDDGALRAAEAWVRAPEEETRRAALTAANAGDQKAATTWLAFAAGWSGGSVTAPDKDPLAAPASACAIGANTAVMLAATAGDSLGVTDRIRACAEAGIRFAEGGEAKVLPPAQAAARSGLV
jgi:hypothetical protein